MPRVAASAEELRRRELERRRIKHERIVAERGRACLVCGRIFVMPGPACSQTCTELALARKQLKGGDHAIFPRPG